jgi:hypothetical protein
MCCVTIPSTTEFMRFLLICSLFVSSILGSNRFRLESFETVGENALFEEIEPLADVDSGALLFQEFKRELSPRKNGLEFSFDAVFTFMEQGAGNFHVPVVSLPFKAIHFAIVGLFCNTEIYPVVLSTSSGYSSLGAQGYYLDLEERHIESNLHRTIHSTPTKSILGLESIDGDNTHYEWEETIQVSLMPLDLTEPELGTLNLSPVSPLVMSVGSFVIATNYARTVDSFILGAPMEASGYRYASLIGDGSEWKISGILNGIVPVEVLIDTALYAEVEIRNIETIPGEGDSLTIQVGDTIFRDLAIPSRETSNFWKSRSAFVRPLDDSAFVDDTPTVVINPLKFRGVSLHFDAKHKRLGVEML